MRSAARDDKKTRTPHLECGRTNGGTASDLTSEQSVKSLKITKIQWQSTRSEPLTDIPTCQLELFRDIVGSLSSDWFAKDRSLDR